MSSEPDWLDEVRHLPVAERMREVVRVLESRDTRQVPCPADHKTEFEANPLGPCPGCGAAL